MSISPFFQIHTLRIFPLAIFAFMSTKMATHSSRNLAAQGDEVALIRLAKAFTTVLYALQERGSSERTNVSNLFHLFRFI